MCMKQDKNATKLLMTNLSACLDLNQNWPMHFIMGEITKAKVLHKKKRLRKDWVIMRQLIMTKKNPNLPEGH